MLKYAMAATALKFFSATPQTKWMYRQLGNVVGQNKRARRPGRSLSGARMLAP